MSEEGLKSFLQTGHIIFLPVEKKNLPSIYANSYEAGVTILSEESMDEAPALQDFVLLKVSVSSPVKIFTLGICVGIDKCAEREMKENSDTAADLIFKNRLS